MFQQYYGFSLQILEQRIYQYRCADNEEKHVSAYCHGVNYARHRGSDRFAFFHE